MRDGRRGAEAGKRRLALAVLTGLVISLPFVATAAAASNDRYGATIQPSETKPATNVVLTIAIANRNNSTNAANNAHVSVPDGFVVNGATLSAAASASGSCTAAAWTVTLDATTSTIGAVAPPDPASELCPGGTLAISFTATTPSAEGPYTWTTSLLEDTTAFSLQGAQPTVTIDGTAPPAPTISTQPANPSNSSTASFAFTDADPTATFRCQLDGGSFSDCPSPKSYASLTEGIHSFAVKAVDSAGNESPVTAVVWTVDLTPPPPPTITSEPPTVTAETSASFSFTDADPTASYLCQLDGAAFASCVSPASYPGPLAAGPHTFATKARDPAGNDSSVTSYGWTVDLTNPVVTIDPTTEPPDPTNKTSASFAFASSKSGSMFACQLDGAGFSPCTSPISYSGLADGEHSFAVKATDALGNTGLATAWSWTVDTVAPGSPSITAAPRNPTNQRNASFSFSGGEPSLAYACSLDGQRLAACTSPVSYSDLADANHVFVVEATDMAGNTGPSTARNWAVDTSPPTTTITSKPEAVSGSVSATFGFTSNEAHSRFACSLDRAAFDPCASPVTYGGLADGIHTFVVRATDPAGNSEQTPPSYSWNVSLLMPPDSTAPGPVRRLKRTVGYRVLRLRWSPPSDLDFDHVQVVRSYTRKGGRQKVVYAGRGRHYVDKRFRNGLYYRYTVRAYDRSGNASRSVRIVVPPGALLRSPSDRRVMRSPPVFRWAGITRATYYNVQVYRGSHKLLSAWPARPRLKMARRWVYQNHRFSLWRGRYRWYVWPGFGARSKGAYGRLLGTSTFVVR
jgi:hypothetical protein